MPDQSTVEYSILLVSYVIVLSIIKKRVNRDILLSDWIMTTTNSTYIMIQNTN